MSVLDIILIVLLSGALAFILYQHRALVRGEIATIQDWADREMHSIRDMFHTHQQTPATEAHPVAAMDVPSVSWSAQPVEISGPISPKPYVQPDGSTVGRAKDGTAIPQPVSLLSRIANGDVDAIREGLLTGGSVTGPIAAVYAARLLNTAGTYEGGILFLKSLPPDALASVKGAYLNPAGLYASDQAGYDPHRPAQQALYADAWATIEARLAV